MIFQKVARKPYIFIFPASPTGPGALGSGQTTSWGSPIARSPCRGVLRDPFFFQSKNGHFWAKKTGRSGQGAVFGPKRLKTAQNGKNRISAFGVFGAFGCPGRPSRGAGPVRPGTVGCLAAPCAPCHAAFGFWAVSGLQGRPLRGPTRGRFRPKTTAKTAKSGARDLGKKILRQKKFFSKKKYIFFGSS